MHYRINVTGEKASVVEKLKADKGPTDAGLKVLFDMAVATALRVLAPQPDKRNAEVIAYVSLGEPDGSVSYSIKIES